MVLEQELEKILTKITLSGKNPDGSYTRLPFSSEYFQAADSLESIMESSGLSTTRDSVGNIIGTLPGENPKCGSILTGSHLDTVKQGGLFDGALGIAASILCINLLRNNHIKLQHSLQVIGFQGEEGSNLGGTFGSRSMMGLIPPISKSYEQILQTYGISEENIKNAAIDTSSIKNYIELHIEQGKILEHTHSSIGIVSGIVGITRYQITVTGESNHAGTTPMNLRHDALTAAAHLLVYIDELASKTNQLAATVGQLSMSPGSVSVIPGSVTMTLEIRHMEQPIIDFFVENLKNYAKTLTNADFSFEKIIEKPSVYCSSSIMEKIKDICDNRKLSYQILPSGAGHDGNALGQRMPIAMIFVPSQGGLSHCKEEWTNWSDAVHGALVLYDTLLELDKEA